MVTAPGAARRLTSTRDLPPVAIGEIVLKTSRYAAMLAWYQTVLGVEPYLATDRFSFHRVRSAYPFVQQLVIFNIPGMEGVLPTSAGLHHMQFKHAAMDELLERYDLLRAVGILPQRTLHHGVAIACYYRDVDGNEVELSAPCFATEAEYLAYLQTEEYRQRSGAGVPIDPDALVRRYRAGEPIERLIRLPAERTDDRP
jgi:catechol 2,3-dioxygenase-like lactoylglutathione lyase family enzyme